MIQQSLIKREDPNSEVIGYILFDVKYKNGTQEIRLFENSDLNESMASKHAFELYCLTNPRIESYKRYITNDWTTEPEIALKKCRRYLFNE